MTDLLYQTDAYLRRFEAQVTGNFEGGLTLDRSAFYPGGGGQPADQGVLSAGGRHWRVVSVNRAGSDPLHLLDGADLPEAGVAVTGELGWERRYQLMRTHTAMHILCGVIWRDYGATVTGGQMEPLRGRMDFKFEGLGRDLVAEIETAIGREVEAARDVRVAILPRAQAFQIPDLIRTEVNLLPEGLSQVRTVEIVGLDLQADGGTHVANTREVGRLRIADYMSKGKVNKRIYLEIS
ncbi:MAG: alanyl-tRNA editing protein [Candidatus Promineifilaceae bacterium]